MSDKTKWLLISVFILLLNAVVIPLFINRPSGGRQTASRKASLKTEYTVLSDNSVLLTKFYVPGDATEIVIPEEIDGHPVSELGENSLCVPLEDRVSAKNGLMQVKQRPLTAVTIPAALKRTDGNPFSDLPGLQKIMIVSGNTVFRFENGLLINTETETVAACLRTVSGEIVIPEGILSVGKSAFRNCDISSVRLPASLKTIENSAFLNCWNLTEIHLPDGIEHISEDAFDMAGKPMPGAHALLKNGIDTDYPFTIYASEGTEGQRYAESVHYPFTAE